MASTDARPVPIKNTAYRLVFPILDADGDLVAGASGLDSEVSKDQGTFTDCTNEATEIATLSGMYYLDLTSTEMNADCVAGVVKSTEGKTTPFVLYPQESGDIKVEVQNVAANAITATAIASNAITAAKIATDAITAAKIAADAIGSSELATAAVNEIRDAITAILGTATVEAACGTALGTYDAPTKAELDAGFAGLNDLSAAAVNAEVDTALADYDGPTKAELDAGLAGLPTAGAIADAVCDEALAGHTTAGTLGKVVADIEADTNELQGDDVPGLIAALPDAAAVNAEVDTALADYDGPTKAELDAGFAGLNDLSAAAVNAEVDTALADYDGPTKAELDVLDAKLDGIQGATFNTSTDSLEAIRDRGDAAWTTGAGGSSPTVEEIRAEMDSNSTQLAAIVEDTNELQTDDVPGLIAGLSIPTAGAIADAVCDEDLFAHTTAGTLGKAISSTNNAVDTEVGAIKAVTDQLPNAGALTDLAAIKTVTDNLPNNGALSALADIDGKADTLIGLTDTEIGAIKAVTDALPDGGALTTLLGNLAAIKAVTDLLPNAGALNDLAAILAVVGTTGAVLTASERDAIADAHLDRTDGVESGLTPRQQMRATQAAAAGKLSGAGTGTLTLRDKADTKDRITAATDANGNRSAVTLDLS